MTSHGSLSEKNSRHHDKVQNYLRNLISLYQETLFITVQPITAQRETKRFRRKTNRNKRKITANRNAGKLRTKRKLTFPFAASQT